MKKLTLSSFASFRLEIFKYGLMGIGSAIIYSFLLVSLIELLNFDKFFSSVLAYLASLVFSFFLAHYWVFKSRKDKKLTFLKFSAVSLIAFTINSVGFYFLVEYMNFYYIYSQIFLFFLIAFNNFFLNKFWTFDPK